MKIILIILLFFITNCSFNKVVKHHGVHYLEKKQTKLAINDANQNDVLKLLGPPSTQSTFDNDVWIYIERKTSREGLFKLAKKKLLVNNVLILEINERGMLVKKDFLDINDMKKIDFSKESTKQIYSKRSFVYDFLSSLRQKINDPLGKRKKGVTN